MRTEALVVLAVVGLAAGASNQLTRGTWVYGSVEPGQTRRYTNVDNEYEVQVQLLRLTRFTSSSYQARMCYSNTDGNSTTCSPSETSTPITRYSSARYFTVAVASPAQGQGFTYAIRYCAGSCGTSYRPESFCPNMCTGRGGCDLIAGSCKCDGSLTNCAGSIKPTYSSSSRTTHHSYNWPDYTYRSSWNWTLFAYISAAVVAGILVLLLIVALVKANNRISRRRAAESAAMAASRDPLLGKSQPTYGVLPYSYYYGAQQPPQQPMFFTVPSVPAAAPQPNMIINNQPPSVSAPKN